MSLKQFIIALLILVLIFPQLVFANDLEEEYKLAREIGRRYGERDKLIYDSIDVDVIDVLYEKLFNYEDPKHKEYFIIGYVEGFIKSHKEEDDKSKVVDDIEYAKILGLILGQLYGNRDFEAGTRYKPRAALPSNRTLISYYDLDKLSSEDRSTFLETFKENFEIGYREAYIKANFENIKLSYEDGIVHGEYFGARVGEMDAIEDYLLGLASDYKRNLPADGVIEANYSLDKDEAFYREGFLEGFKRAYRESYIKSYSNVKIDENTTAYEEGYTKGKEAGLTKGQALAMEDYHKGINKDWRRHFLTSSEIISEYNLYLQETTYINSFVNAFVEGLYEGYNNEYNAQYGQWITGKSVTEIIPISGGRITSADNVFTLEVVQGTYYNPITVRIEAFEDIIPTELIKASKIYRINIANKSKEADNDKYLKISFEYYGEGNGGIYKQVGDKWFYIPSKIEDGYITAFIKPNSIKEGGSAYRVFVDKNYKILFDIRSHWAKDEIITYVKRGIVTGYNDRSFRPDRDITKGEFFVILGRVYNWHLPNSNTLTIEDAIKYAISNGYIEGSYKDIVNSPISYREAESIMRKLFNSDTFHWYNVAAKMLYEKLYKSKSYYSMDYNLTRAEAIYMFYILNEWRY
ncbi:MAG: S-layer homology domain-containing protein [Tissierellia bacterium]|nr:S-layer homology domain-containing protein [Tissierellia bacterium]